MQTSELIALLHAQAEEIARAGHNGWGNTMTYAAEVLGEYVLWRHAVHSHSSKMTYAAEVLGEYVATLDAIIRREQET